jgi:hypothetical protein
VIERLDDARSRSEVGDDLARYAALQIDGLNSGASIELLASKRRNAEKVSERYRPHFATVTDADVLKFNVSKDIRELVAARDSE